tara:strand:- start:487 stop:1128 length:642 start_codon:yes stop_codon:yes gene_type:complete
MRSKEDAHDYRYFPDPDLRPLILTEERIESLKASSLDSYNEKNDEYTKDYDLSLYDSEVLLSDKKLSKFFDKSVGIINEPKLICNWLISEVIKHINTESFSLDEYNFAKLIKALKSGAINNNSGKELLEKIIKTNEDVDTLIKSMGLEQESSESLLNEVVDNVLKNNPKEAERIMNGELKLMSFFVGQIMKETKGKGNPGVINSILKKKFKIN